jgi:hypothetical protein
MKLTMISVYVWGRRTTIFRSLLVGADGKVRVSTEVVNQILKEMGCTERGVTFTVGY